MCGWAPLRLLCGCIMQMHVATATYLPPKKSLKNSKKKNDNKQITPTKNIL